MSHPKYPELPAYDELETLEGEQYPVAPEGIKVYSNGAGFSITHGRIVYAPGTFAHNPHAITSSEEGSALIRKRWDKVEQELRDAISEEFDGIPSDKVLANIGALLLREVVMNNDQPGRTRSDVWEKVGRKAGIFPDKDRIQADRHTGQQFVEGLTPDLAVKLKELVLALSPHQQSSEVEDVAPPTIDSSFQSPHQFPTQESDDY